MPEAWLRITVTSPSDELVAVLAEGLVASGGSAVEENGAELSTYVPLDGDNSDSRAAEVTTRLRDVVGEDVDIRWEVVPEQDWIARWRSSLHPRRVGPRIIVAPSWTAPATGPGDILIRIDPQMAFGTGEHASTRGVLRLLQRVLLPQVQLLDVGTGSAILAIAAARLGARHVVAVESDADALPNAQQNVAANSVAERVTIVHGLVDEAFLKAYGGGSFDGIMANVLSGVLRPLLPAFHHALVTDGWVILSGILVEEAEDIRAAATEHGFRIEAEDLEEQWWSALLRRL
jgi:ribosomal protein L11 methyltransferase